MNIIKVSLMRACLNASGESCFFFLEKSQITLNCVNPNALFNYFSSYPEIMIVHVHALFSPFSRRTLSKQRQTFASFQRKVYRVHQTASRLEICSS